MQELEPGLFSFYPKTLLLPDSSNLLLSSFGSRTLSSPSLHSLVLQHLSSSSSNSSRSSSSSSSSSSSKAGSGLLRQFDSGSMDDREGSAAAAAAAAAGAAAGSAGTTAATAAAAATKLWILKPYFGSQGNGLLLAAAANDIPAAILKGEAAELFVAQQYIHNPFLLNNKKFDFRVYVLLLGVYPHLQVCCCCCCCCCCSCCCF